MKAWLHFAAFILCIAVALLCWSLSFVPDKMIAYTVVVIGFASVVVMMGLVVKLIEEGWD